MELLLKKHKVYHVEELYYMVCSNNAADPTSIKSEIYNDLKNYGLLNDFTNFKDKKRRAKITGINCIQTQIQLAREAKRNGFKNIIPHEHYYY